MSEATSLIDEIPRTLKKNLEWRVRMREACRRDRKVRHAMYDAAMDDVLFFFNAFLWVYEPRGKVKTLPFLVWPHQVPVILAMDQAIRDAEESQLPLAFTLKKSRAQGGTYAYLGVDIRRAIRDKDFSVGLVTRNEKLVDSLTDKDTIMYKVAWMLDLLPYWMLPGGYSRNLTDHTIGFQNGSLFTGYSATGDVGRGGRKTKFDLDEIGSEEFISGSKDYKVMSSLSSVSNCTFLVSTFGGETGVFYEAATDPENTRLLKLDWRDNPEQTKCAYVMRDGKLEALNFGDREAVLEYGRVHAAELRKIGRRGHQMEGKFRSPWYDAYCLLPGATPRFVARELDMNPRGAVGKVFDPSVLDRMREQCRPPDWEGKPVFDLETCEVEGLIEREDGPLKLWFRPGLDHTVPRDRYVVGCDISAGGRKAESSNSSACGVHLSSGRQIMDYTVNGVKPTHFGYQCVALSKWLCGAYLGWEATGPGSLFEEAVVDDAGYWNIYLREPEELGTHRKLQKKAGWWNGNNEAKAKLFESLELAMCDEEFFPASTDLVRECGEYETDSTGKIVHKPSKDEGLDEKQHGDRCVAAGVARLLCVDRPYSGLDNTEERGEDVPYWSMAGRLERRKQLEDGDVDNDFAGFRRNTTAGAW